MEVVNHSSVMGPRSNLNAVVIDDDIDVRDLFVEMLQMNQVNILGVGSNGKDALELYKTFHPDFVFIDYLMPDYDGLYGAEKIKAFDPHAKVILVSGSYFETGKLDDLVSAVLKKPIEINDVVRVINKMICSMDISK